MLSQRALTACAWTSRRLFTNEQVAWLSHYRPKVGTPPPPPPSEPHNSSSSSRSRTSHARDDGATTTSRPLASPTRMDVRTRQARLVAALERYRTAAAAAHRNMEAAQQASALAANSTQAAAGRQWATPVDGPSRIALRSAHGTFLAVSMDRQRLTQTAILVPVALFRQVRSQGEEPPSHDGVSAGGDGTRHGDGRGGAAGHHDVDYGDAKDGSHSDRSSAERQATPTHTHASLSVLRSHYDTCVGAARDNAVYQVAACENEYDAASAWQVLTLPDGRVALRSAHGGYLSARSDQRTVALTKRLGRSARFERVALPEPARPSGSFDGALHVSGTWLHPPTRDVPRSTAAGGGAWCILMRDAAAGGLAQLRLCFNDSSRSEYWEERATATGSAASLHWVRLGEAALRPSVGSRFSIDVRCETGLVAYSVDGGNWVSTPTHHEQTGSWILAAAVVSHGASIDDSRAWFDDVALSSARAPAMQRLPSAMRAALVPSAVSAASLPLPSADAPPSSPGRDESRSGSCAGSTAAARVVDAPPEFTREWRRLLRAQRRVAAGRPPASVPSTRDRGGAARQLYRLYNPTIAWRHGGAGNSSRLRLLAKVSSYHLCGASDVYETIATERAGELLSFLVAFDVCEQSGEIVGDLHALSHLNRAVTRHVKWGDGPEDPRAVILGARAVTLLWARTTQPEYTTYAYVGPPRAPGDALDAKAHGRLVHLSEVGCEACPQKNWVPLVHRGTLYVESSIQPRVVLRVDLRTGMATPVRPRNATATRDDPQSFTAAAALQSAVSATLHGGPPSLRLALGGGAIAYLGLAHFNRLLAGARSRIRRAAILHLSRRKRLSPLCIWK